MGSANFSLAEFARASNSEVVHVPVMHAHVIWYAECAGAANSEVLACVPVHGSAQPFTLHVTHWVDCCSIVGGCLIAWNFSAVKGGHFIYGIFFKFLNLISCAKN
jgi:hypothetical protein